MRRTAIILAVVLAVIVVAVGGTAFYVLTRLDGLVQTAIEEFGSAATGVTVSLGAVEIDPADGRGRLSDLRVGNPPGFAAEDALSIAETSLAIDLGSLMTDTIVIHDVSVRKPRFRYVIGPDGGNIEKIIENVRSADTQADPAPDGGRTDDTAAGQSNRRFVVERLSIRGAEVSVSADQLGPKGLTVALPALELRDLGTEGGGMTPEALLGVIVASLEQTANAEFAKVPSLQGILGAPIAEPVKRTLESTEKALESLGDHLKGLIGD